MKIFLFAILSFFVLAHSVRAQFVVYDTTKVTQEIFELLIQEKTKEVLSILSDLEERMTRLTRTVSRVDYLLDSLRVAVGEQVVMIDSLKHAGFDSVVLHPYLRELTQTFSLQQWLFGRYHFYLFNLQNYEARRVKLMNAFEWITNLPFSEENYRKLLVYEVEN